MCAITPPNQYEYDGDVGNCVRSHHQANTEFDDEENHDISDESKLRKSAPSHNQTNI